MRASWLLMVFAVSCIGFGMEARAQSAEAKNCKAMEADYGWVQDAPGRVTAAKVIEAVNGVPAHCEVEGYIQPHIGFVIELPLSNWNGKFLKFGCGGFCGQSLTAACDLPLKTGFACLVSDMGHKSTGLDAVWAFNNLQAEVDFAFRSTHVNTILGKVLTERFYGRRPERSYYFGCSTGGRQGMVEAQRFPWDFDGIVAGAPVINETGDGMALAWNVISTLGPDGRSILTHDEIRKVHTAAIAACDKDDGAKDGIIGDPRSCKFDPASVPGLSPAQADAVRKIYQGPRTSKGEAIYTGGALPGSELNWLNNYVAADGGRSTYFNFISELFRYMSFLPDPGSAFDVTKFDWDKDYKRLGMMEALYTGQNPDLRKFKAAGGKLLSYQGWADQSVLPLNVVDYYETVERTMGGRQQTQAFFRLFMVPGMNHCQGGEGADAIDYMGAIQAWVENNKAPEMLMSHHLKKTDGPFARPEFPVDPATVAFSRPVYPYPIAPKYKGGDINAATSFAPSR